MKVVKRFAESIHQIEGLKSINWIEYTDGTKEYASESATSALWDEWIVANNAEMYIQDGFTIFEHKDR